MTKYIPKTKLPDLLEIQKASFCWFLIKGIASELSRFSNTFYLGENVRVDIYANDFALKKPKLSASEAKEKSLTYSMELYLRIEVVKTLKKTSLKGFFKKAITLENKRVLIGEIPLMTDAATFVINGYERVVVNQLVRSPGVYFTFHKEVKKTQLSKLFSATLITKRGSWLTIELQCITYKDKNFGFHIKNKKKNFLWIKVDKNYRIPIHLFLAALDLTNEEIYQSITNADFLMDCIWNMKAWVGETLEKRKEGKSISKKRTEVFDLSLIRQLVYLQIFNSKNYDLSDVGRFKLNQKLDLSLPLTKTSLSCLDLLKILNYLIDLVFSKGDFDDIDSLSNRRVRGVGEALEKQVRLGLTRLERSMEEKMINPDLNYLLNANNLINPRPFVSAMKEFFGSSQLSQFMDEVNPLAELNHKRRITALGPGGLSTDHVSFSARDIHPTQYGRLCPIETPEGQNAGLVASLASHARLNAFGFLLTPFFKVAKAKVLKSFSPFYLSAEKEKTYKIASADSKLSVKASTENEMIPVRYKEEFTLANVYEVDFVAISPIQILSVAASLIPFLEHNDANRALMGSNMQRQAVTLVRPQRPIVGTGVELQVARDSYSGLVNYYHGKIAFVTAEQIIVQTKQKHLTQLKEPKAETQLKRYKLEKFLRSNQGSCINQSPIVWPGQVVKTGQLLADGPGIDGGELALGQNLTVAYMPWEGYNFEDAILVSERLVSQNLFTSIHIEKYDVDLRQTKTGPEEMTRKIPNASDYSCRSLDENGLIQKGAFVGPGDILVGKVAPKAESDLLPEEKLLKAIFGEKTADVQDTSLKMPKGIWGRVIDVFVFSKENGDDLPIGTICSVKLFIAEVRKLKVGDKMAGRHGNKGIVSKILPIQDMPYLPDGKPVDLLLNPLGVPSRMNVGQLFEALLGFAGDHLNKRYKIMPFDEMYTIEASRILVNQELKKAAKPPQKSWVYNPSCPGKVWLVDGRSGERFDNPILVGKSYILKLVHLVDDKMHARSTGPYSLVTQQPLGGKSQQGGQRFGEMEVWALEAYGSAYTLQELLTLKSDDIEGRNEVFNAIIKGQPIPKPGIPESFNVLLFELKALALAIKTYEFVRSENDIILGVEASLT